MQSSHHARSALLGAVLALLLAGLAVPAAAHNYLRSSSPEDGDELDAAPEQIELRFDDDVLDLGTEIRLSGPAGTVDLAPATVEGAVVTAAVPPDVPTGEYAVEWRATSGDGHPISGTFSFELLPAAPPATGTGTASAPATVAPVTPPVTPTEAATVPSTAGAADSDQDVALLPEDGSASRIWLLAVPAAVLAGLAVLVARWRRGTP